MKWLLILLACTYSLFSNALSERLKTAQEGSFIVTESKKSYTLLHLHSQRDDTFIIEEISAPAHIVTTDFDWKAWVEKEAPGNTGWTLYEFDKESADLLECFSFTHSSWMKPKDGQNLFSTLMQLDLKPVDEKQRKRIGAEPPHHAIDIRKIWNPPKIIDGNTAPKANFTVMNTRWPKDGSELSKRKIDLYFDADNNAFPFPYWVEVQGMIDQKLRAVDSGYDFKTPRKHMPRRYPITLGAYMKQGKSYTLKINAPSYYKNFELYTTGDQIKKINFLENRIDTELIEITIDPSQIPPGAELMLTPSSHPHIFVELPPLPN